MHAYWRERSKVLHYREGGRANLRCRWEAQATWFKTLTLRGGRFRRDRCCGEILFHSGRLGAGIVSHEMVHAASFYLVWDRGLDPHPDFGAAHEKLCLVQGWLVTQFWRHFYRLHPKKEA